MKSISWSYASFLGFQIFWLPMSFDQLRFQDHPGVVWGLVDFWKELAYFSDSPQLYQGRWAEEKRQTYDAPQVLVGGTVWFGGRWYYHCREAGNASEEAAPWASILHAQPRSPKQWRILENIPLNLKNILYRGSKSKAMIESQPDAREHHLSSDIWYERFQTKIVATDRCIWALEHQYHIQFASCGQKWLYNTPVLKPICTILQTKNVPHLIRILSTKNIANHSFSSGTWAVSGLRLPGVWGCSDWPGWNWVQFFGSNEWGPDKGVHATSLQQNSFI